MPWKIETRLSSSPLHANVIKVKQAHGGDIARAERVDRATVADGIAAPLNFTSPFMIATADCLPLVIASDEVACALHVSRKSLIHGLLDHVPDFLVAPAITSAYIGPHICEEHFVFDWVGPDIKLFAQKFPAACRESKAGLHLSLKKAVEIYLERWHVAPELVSVDPRCTWETEELPSYKRSLRDTQPLFDQLATIVTAVELADKAA